MKDYLVTWSIDVPGDSPEEAAWFARECMERPETTAVVFEVTDPGGSTVIVDLLKSVGPR